MTQIDKQHHPERSIGDGRIFRSALSYYATLNEQTTHMAKGYVVCEPAVKIFDPPIKELHALLNSKNSITKKAPLVFFLCVGLTILAASSEYESIIAISVAIVGCILSFIAHMWDIGKKDTKIEYQLSDEAQQCYDNFLAAADELKKTKEIWQVYACIEIEDKQSFLGAENILFRNSIFTGFLTPPWISVDQKVFFMKLGSTKLYFLPDQILIYDRSGIGTISYLTLQAHLGHRMFIEDSPIPKDATIIDNTPEALNPRTFKDFSYPICAYPELSLTSKTGLNIVLQFSKLGPAEEFKKQLVLLTHLCLEGKMFPKSVYNWKLR